MPVGFHLYYIYECNAFNCESGIEEVDVTFVVSTIQMDIFREFFLSLS